MRRRLTLRREALAALSEDDLAGVGGGNQYVTNVTCPIEDYVPTFPNRCRTFPWGC